MPLPCKTPIDPKLYRGLKDCYLENVNIQNMMKQFQENCQARMLANARKLQEIWGEIGQTTGVDLQNVVWNPHPSDPAIVPVQLNLSNEETIPSKS